MPFLFKVVLFAFGLMVGFLLTWDVKHQPVASVPSTHNVNPWRRERLREFGVQGSLKIEGD